MMNRLLFFSIFTLFCLTISAQTKTWIGPEGGAFSEPSYWDPVGVPGTDNDVVIPTGSDMIFDVVAVIKSFALQGNAVATMTQKLTFSDASSIASNATFNQTFGIFGGTDTLTNDGTINRNGAITIRTMTLINNGTFNVNSNGEQDLDFGATLNNTASGIINLNADEGVFFFLPAGQATLLNSGLINRTTGTGLYEIAIPLQNNNGTISVDTGTLRLNNPLTTLTEGIYNVGSDGILELVSSFTCVGTLSGQLDGPINWDGTLIVESGIEAILDFQNPDGLRWLGGNFSGDGTLTNIGSLNVEGEVNILGASTLNNEGNINFKSTLPFTAYGGTTVNNNVSGVINLLSDGSIIAQEGIGTIINTGIIHKEPNTGTFTIDAYITNTSPGEIIAGSGLLQLDNETFEGDGILTGNGSVKLSNSTMFEGTLSPGGSPGTLTQVGNYIASPNAILATEIYGPNPGTEYDVFAVEGDASLDGDILVSLNYAPNLNDEFVILTASSISSCNLPAFITAYYNSYNYSFDLICNPTNVTLKVTNIVLGTEENTLSNLSMYPNPSNGNFTIDLGREYTDVDVQIFNMLGQLISSEKYDSAKSIQQEINASAGIYFVKVNTAKEGSKTLRVIKQ